MFELDGIDVKQKKSVKDLNECLKRLTALRVNEVGPWEDEWIVPKVVWKVRCYIQGIVYRTVELTEATSAAWNNGNRLAAIMLARGVLETTATVFDFSRRLIIATDSKNFQSIDNVVMSHTFSGTYFEQDKGVDKLPKINSLIDRVDRHLFNDKRNKPLRSCYDNLSEFAHPNWTGTVGFYGQLHQSEFKQYFAPYPENVRSTSTHIVAGIGAIRIIEDCVKNIEECLPEIWKLYDENAQLKNS